MSSLSIRVKQLEGIEKDIASSLYYAGEALNALSSPSSSEKAVQYTDSFVKCLHNVEQRLSEQIGYLGQVATAQWHGDSVYGDEKNLELAHQRTLLIDKRLKFVVDAVKEVHDNSTTSRKMEEETKMNAT
eukprot:m.311168 g.311168  ORF g.311168 m.311168 type:complete len:130 (+) comp61218_c0_seq1:2-391(+)